MRRWILVCALGLAACGGGTSNDDGAASSSFGDEMPDDLPAGGCRDTEGCDAATTSGTGSGNSSGTAESECVGSDDCDGAGACGASWDGDARGPFSCRFACIPTLDEASWCSDDASCCDDGAECTPRGYCVLTEADETGSSSGTGSGSGTGG